MLTRMNFLKNFNNQSMQTVPLLLFLFSTMLTACLTGGGTGGSGSGASSTSDSSSSSSTSNSTGSSNNPSSSSNVVTTFAGSGTQGSTDSTGSAASFNNPTGVAVDSSGNVYVADSLNHKIRKITSAGVVTTLAGSGTQGSVDGTGSTALFDSPRGVAVADSGDLYVTEATRIRKVTSAGVVTTLAGSAVSGSTDGTGAAALFGGPVGVAVDSSGNAYVADSTNNKIRKITSAGVVTTFAGSGDQGSANGTGAAASFNSPYGIAVDSSGNVYVAEYHNNLVRKISSAGVVTTFAGAGAQGSADGAGTSASFYHPSGLAVDSSGNVYVADSYSHKVRKINPAGVVITLAGSGKSGSSDGNGLNAQFSFPSDVDVDSSGNVYVADSANNKIRKITP